MNTAKLKRFATEARNKLRQGVANRLTALGFNEAGVPIASPILVSGGAMWKEKPCTVAFYHGFKALEQQLQKYGVNHVVEEAAYTWFNRLMAIRILTMNNLCEPVLRYVGSTRTPLIVDEARQGHLPETDEENRKALLQLLEDDTKTTEQFAMLIAAFCHNTPLIEKCFGLSSNYTDILVPSNILSEGGFIDTLNSTDFISEEDYQSSELLGWLYQFYISEKKDQVFAKKGKYDADDIPAATQIFTPNWIVKYMVQNAIGGVLGGKDKLPENQRKYYVDTPEQPKAICHDIEELKVADLACGSGHILNECFDLLYDLYISEGYTRREAVECIFTKNLTGIDIDTRAKQLATFALMLKACQRDASLVDASLMPHVYDMSGMPEESRELGSIQIFDEPDSDNPVIAALSTHYDAIVMNPPYMPTNKIDALSKYVNEHYKEGKADMFAVFMMVCMDRLKECGRMAMINMQSWMFLSSFESLRELFLKEYTLSSMLHLGTHTFDELSGEVVQNTAFVFEKTQPKAETSGIYYRLTNGKNCEEKRQIYLLGNHSYIVKQKQFLEIPSFRLGYWIGEDFVKALKNKSISDYAPVRRTLQCGNVPLFTRAWHEVDFNKIFFSTDVNRLQNSFILKWAPYSNGGSSRKWYGNLDGVVEWGNNGARIKATGNAIIPNEDLYFIEAAAFNRMISTKGLVCRLYFPGTLFGDSTAMIVAGDNNLDMLSLMNSKVANYIMEFFNPRSAQTGTVEEIPFAKINANEIVQENVSISKSDWDAHETSWDFEKNPLLAVDGETYIDNIKNAIERHRQETGEELCIDPAAPQFGSLRWRYDQYQQKWESQFIKLHANEEELNRRFIEIYGLQDELNPHIDYEDITILQQGEISLYRPMRGIECLGSDLNESKIENLRKNNWTIEKEEGYVLFPQSRIMWNDGVVIKQFISYAVGCMMGRYRLDRPGLAIAHPNETPEEVAEYQIPGTDEKFWIDTDGIIPLLPEDCGFHDNAANRLATFVRQVLGEQTQTENLNFIEECLGKSIEQYFMKDFWKDHKKMYQNRPIYWLFASKKGAFQVLVYVHRMNVATVERIRSRYLLPYIERLNKRIDDLQANESTLSTKQRNQLKTLRAQVEECSEYHNRLAVIAERGIVPDLDAGIPANHALFGDVVTKLK